MEKISRSRFFAALVLALGLCQCGPKKQDPAMDAPKNVELHKTTMTEQEADSAPATAGARSPDATETKTHPITLLSGSDPEVLKASAEARQNFKFFWRELYWERRRAIPGLTTAVVKLHFTDGSRFLTTDGSHHEHMWVGDVEFDGKTLKGTLINAPNWLQNVKEEEAVEKPFSDITDWLFAAEGKAYGGYTVQVIRSRMSEKEREEHDDAMELDFPEPGEVRTELLPDKARMARAGLQEPESRGAFKDHILCTNMLPRIEPHFKEDPSLVNAADERGWKMLHTEALAGNLGIVRILVKYGADLNAKTPDGRSAADLARGIGWDEIASYLETDAKKEQAAGNKQ
jgi:uncharacterized protein YegJ (DUF2314 family)